MKTTEENEETKSLFEKLKLSLDEIRSILPSIDKFEAAELEELQITLFNLSMVLIKLNTDEPA